MANSETTVVSLEEYRRLEECTKNPAPPTQAVLDGAELLRSLRARKSGIGDQTDG